MKKVWESLKHSLYHLLYPSNCLHCHELLAPDSSVLCASCGSLLELLERQDRCKHCFNLKPPDLSYCPHCAKNPSLFFRTAAAFDYLGPAASIIKKLKYGGQPHLAKGAGAFMIAQFTQLDWPIPDAIIPVPISFGHWLDRGFNQSELLANELGSALQVPVWNAIKQNGSVTQSSWFDNKSA